MPMVGFGRPAFSAVCVFDRDKRIHSVSKDYALLLGYGVDDLVGTSWERLSLPAESAKARRCLDELYATGEGYSAFRALRRADGSLIDVLIQCCLLDSRDGEARLIHASLTPVEAEYEAHTRPDSPLLCGRTIQDTSEELAIYAERHGLVAAAEHLRMTLGLVADELQRLLDEPGTPEFAGPEAEQAA